jgi:uncharacterized protein
MEIECDEEKRQKTLRERGLDFADASLMDMATAFTILDSRKEYSEDRFVSYGLIGSRLHVLCWTRRDDRMRIISLRKANDREQKAFSGLAGPSSAAH